MNLRPDQLRSQYEQAVRRWPFFHDIEAAYGLPRFLLFAVGSRETDLHPKFTEGATGDKGHGHGIFQLDDRWHTIPEGFDTNPRLQADTAATKLDFDYDRWGSWIATLNYYNSGSPLAEDTTGGDYGPDVWGRREWLAANIGNTGSGGAMPPIKLVTREEWGARPPRSVTKLDVKVATAHWGGDSPGKIDDHEDCAWWLRTWQNQHMDTSQLAPQGASDIAYNLAVCQHGYVFILRGKGVRSAANGNNEGNSSSYAIVYIGGTGAPFTNEAKVAFNQAAEYLGASLDWGHRDWVGTGCPGDTIYSWVHSGHPSEYAPGPTISRLPLFIVNQEDNMPTPFRRRPVDFDPQDGRAPLPCYDYEWVPANKQVLNEEFEYRINIHIQQLSPDPDVVAGVAVYGPAFDPPTVATVARGDTLELQPHAYGPVAVVSLDGVELECSWDRIIEPRRKEDEAA